MSNLFNYTFHVLCYGISFWLVELVEITNRKDIRFLEVVMFRNLIKKADTEIIVIKPPESHLNEWGGVGLVFYVKNEKGLLSTKYGYLEN